MNPALFAMLLLITAYDIKYKKIPNRYLLLMLAMLICGAYFPEGINQAPSLIMMLAGAGLGLACGFILYSVGLFAAGDGKLFMVLGAWLGPPQIVWLIVLSILFSGIQSTVFLIYKKQFITLLRRWYQSLILRQYIPAAPTDSCKTRLPMAGAITLATFILIF